MCSIIVNIIIKYSFVGKDIVVLAETRSGKTGAFTLPILQAFRENPQSYFVLILTPTHELAYQISEQMEAFRYRDDFAVQF